MCTRPRHIQAIAQMLCSSILLSYNCRPCNILSLPNYISHHHCQESISDKVWTLMLTWNKMGINSSKCHSLSPQDTFGFKMLMREFGYFAILRQNICSSTTDKLQCNVWYTVQQQKNHWLGGRQQLDCKNSNLTVSDRYITQQHMQRNRCLQCERKQNILLLPVCMGGRVQEVQEQREKKNRKLQMFFWNVV